MSTTHLIIPDTQVKAGVPLDHLRWAGKYIIDHKPEVVIHLGDHADMPSLSSWDRGKMAAENRRYVYDIEAANEGFDTLMAPIHRYNAMRSRNKKRQYSPRKIFLLGNHENRITRFVESNAVLEHTLKLSDLNYSEHGFEVYPFLEVVELDGIWYSHYFYNPRTGRPWGGMPETRLKQVGNSFTQGHVQGKMIGEVQRANGRVDRGLVVGSFYLHDEDYIGPQGNNEWRGIIVKHEVRDGQYDLMEVSTDFLCRKYEHMPLKKFLEEKYGGNKS